MKLSSITIRGMHRIKSKTYDLKQFNYFVGPNGAGKSTIMQAIQLAILGYIPGTDKNKSAIFKHANTATMSVELYIEDGGSTKVINRTWTRTSKDIVATVTTIPEDLDIPSLFGGTELPIFNFNEFVGMTANKLKDWFINFLPTENTDINWDSTLRGAITDFGAVLDQQFITDSISYVNGITSTGIDKIREFNTYLKQQQSSIKAEIARLQSTIQSLIYYEDCDDSQDVEYYKENNRQDMIIRDNIKRQLVLIQQNAEIHKKLSAYTDVVCGSAHSDPHYRDNIQTIKEADDIISQCNADITAWTAELTTLNQQIQDKRSVVANAGICPYSGKVCDAIYKMITVFEQDIINIEAEIKYINQTLSNRKAELHTASEQKTTCAYKNAAIVTRYNEYASLVSQLHPEVAELDIDALQKQLTDIDTAIDVRNDLIIKIEANRQYNELTQTLTTQKFKIEQNLEILKVWIKLTDVNGLQSKIMNTPFENLSNRVTNYLRKFLNRSDIVAMFNLTEKANSFSFGIGYTDSPVYHEYDLISSGERCLFTLSLLLSIVDSSTTNLPIIMVDDILDHLDKDRIQACFETLYDIDTVQIILAGVQPCLHQNAAEFAIYIDA